jgi:predicted DCC family thiol-disulfide oxidoreductase YuxK
VLYDGVCALCNRFVTFILRRDPRGLFRFAPIQGEAAREVLAAHGQTSGRLDTMWVVAHPKEPAERLLSRGRAALFILERLGGGWRTFARAAGWLPDVVLNAGYRVVASSRYRVWGKYDACPIPPPEWRDRFIA